jgi:5-methylcytosine-specific restriction protein B
MPKPINVFSLIDKADQNTVKDAIENAYHSSGPSSRSVPVRNASKAEEEADTGGLEPNEVLKLTPFDGLIGVDTSVYRQIEAAVNSGKQHLMFYGPPGTGKTTLARWLAGVLNGRNWTLITGSADWSSQDIIGGYQPMAGGTVKFFPGVLLRDFDRPLIIDELNRCDIDKVIGPLFTVLSGQSTTLPYRQDASDAESPQYTILPTVKAGAAAHEFAPGRAWRLIATINSIDKASLYQMSYALSRRFAWIYVDAPSDTAGFIKDYLEKARGQETRAVATPPPLASIWSAVNQVRLIGAAPVIDAIQAMERLTPGLDLLAAPEGDAQVAYLDVFDLYFLPLLDGILSHEAEAIAIGVSGALGLADDSSEAVRLKRRLQSVAV